MRISELGECDGVRSEGEEEQQVVVEEASVRGGVVVARLSAKRALVGAGARVLFYPTLLYNVLRNRFEAEFRWWDRVDQVGLPPLSLRLNSTRVIKLSTSLARL
jgi:atypical dual specificity phosphatase